MKICILIPAYNEAETIGSLVREIKTMGQTMDVELDVLVIDDGSKDKTSEIAGYEGANVLRHKKNEGKGFSLREGFDYILKQEYDSIITMDGDGQHDPKAIPRFIESASNSDAAIITGNRMDRAKNMPLIRLFTNKFMSFVISWIAGQEIPDTQCGYRLIKREVLDNVKFSSCKFEIESEVLIRASQHDYKIASIPIKSIYASEESQINPIIDTMRFIRLIFRIIFRSSRANSTERR